MTTVSHRERVLAALAHEEPDRVPIDVGATYPTQIHRRPYVRLLRHLGWHEEADRSEQEEELTFMGMAVLSEQFLRFLDVDCRNVTLGPPDVSRERRDEQHWLDEWGVLWVRGESGSVRTEGPFQRGEPTVADLERHPWPDPSDAGRYRGLRERAGRVREEGYAVVFDPGLGVLDIVQRLRGLGEWLADLLVNPSFAQALMDRVHAVVAETLARGLDEVGDSVDIALFYEDVGAQDRCLMRPELYRRVVKPFHASLVETIRARTAAKVMMHSDGAIREVLPDLIEIGVEVINPVQVTAKGMDSRLLKREFGRHLSFWGAVDTQWALPFGTVDEVREEARRRLRDLAPGGGYVFATEQAIQSEVPPENILALFETAREYGVYERMGRR